MNRTFNRFLVLACVGSFVPQLPMQASSLMAQAQITQSCEQIDPSNKEICQVAEKITVRVSPQKSDDAYKASGILIDKQERQQNGKPVYLYLVLTNDHVLKGLKKRATASGSGYRVQTFDGQTYPAFLYPELNWQRNDLGLLWFSSLTPYETAKLGDSTKLNEGEKVFVSGFPCEDGSSCQEGFIFTSGEPFIELIKQGKALDAGYQLGFTNETKNGMSGGSVLDQRGLVVGINGRGKEQDIGWRSGDQSVEDSNPYAYMDGTEPPPETQERFKQFAWAIPIETYKKYKTQKPFNGLQIPTPEKIGTSSQNQPSTATNPSPSPNLTTSPLNKNGGEKKHELQQFNQILNVNVPLIPVIFGLTVIGATGFVLGKKSGASQGHKNSDKEKTNSGALPSKRTEISAGQKPVAEIIIDSYNQTVELSINGSTLLLKTMNRSALFYYQAQFDHIEFQAKDSKLLEEGDTIKIIPITSQENNNQREYPEILLVKSFPNNQKFIPVTNPKCYEFRYRESRRNQGYLEEHWDLYLVEKLPKKFSHLIIEFIRQQD